jgi:hypothetical protein
MPRRITPERIVTEAGAELGAALGSELRSVVLYGSAETVDFRPDRSDLNFAAVAEPITYGHLQRVAQWYARWRSERVAAPLLLAPSDLTRSLDVFPLEMLDIQERHRILIGDDLFTSIVVAPANVRLECEREAKGKLVRLRALYLELAGSPVEIRELMLDSRKTFLHVMRGLAFLRGVAWEPRETAVVATFTQLFGVTMPVFATLTSGRDPGPVETRFADYLGEIEALAALADTAGIASR